MPQALFRSLQRILFALGFSTLLAPQLRVHAEEASSRLSGDVPMEVLIQTLSSPMCVSDAMLALPELQSKWIRNDAAVQSSLNLKKILSGAVISETVYTLPVVFHVIHLGEPVGVGSNISDAQIQSALTALNNQFRKVAGTNGDGAGVDTKIQFTLAKRAPGGAPHTGINRIDGRIINLYATKGINSPGMSGSASEVDIKSLSTWSRTSYLNIWVVTEIDDNDGLTGTQGYAYQPVNSALDGVTIVHSAVGTVGTAKSFTNQGKILTHEVGHYLGLLHTYHQTNSCSSETNCSSQGDLVCDTPSTIFATSCAVPACGGTQQVQNYMDATSQSCQNMFTQGQKDRMRTTLENTRIAILSSNGGVPVYSHDLAIKSAVLPTFVCGAGVQPSVLFSNLGSTTVTSATVRYRVDGGSWESSSFSGSLASGSDGLISLSGLPTLVSGNYSVEFNVANPNGQADQYSANDSLTLSTQAPAQGETINVKFTLDLNGKDNTYTISNAGTVYYFGGPFQNNTQGAVFDNYHCLPRGCHTVSLFDSFGDGQSLTSGGYQVLSELGTVLASGSGNWGSSKTHQVCVAGAAAPTPTPSPTPTPTPYMDLTPPVISWVEPASGTLVNIESGSRITLSVDASDNVEMARVEFYDGANLIGSVISNTLNSARHSFAWSIAGVPDGTHSLKAVAYDVFGNTTETAPVSILMDRVAPSGSITSPAHLSTVTGASVSITATASDGSGSGIRQVEFYADFDTTPLVVDSSAPYSYSWSVGGLSAGVHVIGIKIVDNANNVYMPSTVNILIPPPGAIPGIEVSGTFGGSNQGCFTRAEQEIFMGTYGCNYGCSSTYDVNGDLQLNVLDLVRVMGGVCHE